MCGKYYLYQLAQNSQTGSPPHVREVRTEETLQNEIIRITPACAGSTHALTRFLNLH